MTVCCLSEASVGERTAAAQVAAENPRKRELPAPTHTADMALMRPPAAIDEQYGTFQSPEVFATVSVAPFGQGWRHLTCLGVS